MLLTRAAGLALALWVCTEAHGQSAEADHEQLLGISDFRYVKQPPLTTQKPGEPRCGQDAWEDGNFFDVRPDATERLFSANTDTLSIRLKSAGFPYVPETKFRFWRATSGQIGIFIDANLAAGGASTPGLNQVPGRLIYYDNNYHHGQWRITATNSHVFGPVLYPGGGLALSITLLEFDRDADDVFGNQVLEGLTKLGTEASRGVPPYLVGPLAALSEAVRNAAKAKDDIFGKAYIGFNGKQVANNPRSLSLIAGDIVFVRKANRQRAFNWSNLCYDDSTGAVTTKAQIDGADRYIMGDVGYVVLSILRNADNEATTVRDALTYDAFVGELEKRRSSVSATASAEAAIDALRRGIIDDTLRRSLNDLVSPAISPDDRLRAAYVIAHALHASLATLAKGAADDARCSYLKYELRTGADRAVLLRRLASANSAWTRDKVLEKIGTHQQDCDQSLSSVDTLADFLATTPIRVHGATPPPRGEPKPDETTRNSSPKESAVKPDQTGVK